ncbi:lamin tail domain-containing protein [Actinacidiphila acididurans]|uniref:Lamin tail domain-containing protein n=1 Tax=Actinacidiphila acididurans TaxID=2784346 RepID=A0ABS2TZF1_9ACTN|nr:lamin tail domain-containing protein [Actinacidiphila acididurans]MBM9507881.1 lamin tail domain-containing protein [Actinacidiphila acididurans]
MSRFASRLTATALAAGALLAAAALPATAADHSRHHHPRERSQVVHHPRERSQVVLGAVHHDRSVRGIRSNASLNKEWVTVVNTGRGAVNLSGWTLSDEAHHTYRFTNRWLAGHTAVRVHTGIGYDTAANVYQDRRNSVWNDHRTATLRDSHGRIVDTKSWDHRHH